MSAPMGRDSSPRGDARDRDGPTDGQIQVIDFTTLRKPHGDPDRTPARGPGPVTADRPGLQPR